MIHSRSSEVAFAWSNGRTLLRYTQTGLLSFSESGTENPETVVLGRASRRPPGRLFLAGCAASRFETHIYGTLPKGINSVAIEGVDVLAQVRVGRAFAAILDGAAVSGVVVRDTVSGQKIPLASMNRAGPPE